MHSVEDPALSGILWLVVVGAFAAFLYGFGTGSNDVANAFGTSVGAKTLTLKQAVMIAAVFEFTGAMVLGRVSTGVIAGGIADINAFKREPEVFAYGMVCAMTIAGVWQILASYLEFNVSSTHSIVGCIIGFSICYAGPTAVLWQVPDSSSFPPVKGVVPIIVSWFFSPLFTGACAAFLFFLIRTVVLRRENSYVRSFWLLPFFVVLVFFVCIFFVFTKGAKKSLSSDDDWTTAKSAWLSACVAAGVGLFSAVVILPILRHRADSRFNPDGTMTDKAKDVENNKELAKVEVDLDDETLPAWRRTLNKSIRTVYKAAMHGLEVDVHEVIEDDEIVAKIHAHAEVFEPRTEYAFKYLQVFTATCVVFAHGAGEVGYMAGPLAAIWQAYTEGKVIKEVQAPVWAVFIGAFGLVVGLATYGYKLTRAMGVRLSKLSPTRGVCCDLSTALVIMVCSQYGLPTSSSQCVTGGIIGVGLMEGVVGVNWKFVGAQFGSWVSTLFISGLGTAALFSQGLYAPGKIQGQAQMTYENKVSELATTLIDNYRTELFKYYEPSANAATSSAIHMTNDQIKAWNVTLGSMSDKAKKAVSNDQGTVDPNVLFNYLYQGLSLYQSSSILTVGQAKVLPGAALCSDATTVSGADPNALVACPPPKLLPKDVASTWPPKA